MRNEEQIQQAIETYADTVRRICILHLKNTSDTEDIFQEVFLKYALSPILFKNENHEKAWIIRVTINACKDLLKSFFRSHTVSLEEILPVSEEQDESHREVLEAVLHLPQKYKDAIYLHYFEGYSAVEIGKILKRKTNTVYTLLDRGRKILEKKLGGDEDAGKD